MSVKIQFTAIRKGVKHLPNEAVLLELTEYTRDFAQHVVDLTKPYPPVPANSRYVRTGRLGRYWKVQPRIAGNAISYEIINPVQDPRGMYYSGYVHGAEQQWFHRRTGWRNINDVVIQVGGHEAFRRGTQQIITRKTGAI